MTFTSDDTAFTTALQQVRGTIGDNDSARALLTDEQITWRLSQYGDAINPASIRCVQDILAKLARDVDRSNVGMSATRSQQIVHYKDLLKELKLEKGTVAEIFLGGVSVSEENSLKADTDLKSPGITIGWDKNNG